MSNNNTSNKLIALMVYVDDIIVIGNNEVIVYVDDIIVIGNNEGEIQRLKTYLFNEFGIKDLGSLKYFCRIEVTHSKGECLFPNRNIFLLC